MWYWVKSPDGVETDYNLRELKTALREGKAHLAWRARRYDEKRWMAIKELLTIEREDTEEGTGGEPMSQREEGPTDPPIPTACFACLECGTRLRVRLQRSLTIHRCPSCKTAYKSLQTDGEQGVFLVVPSLRPHTQHTDGTANPRRTVPPEVRAALAVFVLDAAATFEQVRLAYRDHVKQYHPDRVADLGPELKRVAESKTKEFNSAYQVLERFYAG